MIDLAVEAYGRLGHPLKIAGTGSGAAKIARGAAANVEFLGWRSDEDILALYRNCRFLIFPGEEDYGLVPLEAMACGKPVIAFGRGGATETVVDGETGLFFGMQTADALCEAVGRAEMIDWNPAAIRSHALAFGVPQFLDDMARCIGETLAGRNGEKLA